MRPAGALSVTPDAAQPARSKTGAAQDIPLSPVVVAWLRTAQELAAGSEWVFPARRRDKHGRYEHVGMDTLNVALARVKTISLKASHPAGCAGHG